MRVRILVFGAGAIGSLLGGLLSRENEVTIVGRKHHVDEIIHAGAGETVVGPWDRTTRADAERIAGVLTAAGIRTSVTDDVRRELWAKAVVNAAINPLTAVLRRPNGDLAAHPDLRALFDRI